MNSLAKMLASLAPYLVECLLFWRRRQQVQRACKSGRFRDEHTHRGGRARGSRIRLARPNSDANLEPRATPADPSGLASPRETFNGPVAPTFNGPVAAAGEPRGRVVKVAAREEVAEHELGHLA